MRRAGGEGGKLKRSECSRVRNGRVREREVVASPRRFGGRRMVEGRGEEVFASHAEFTLDIKQDYSS
jgi:hypothetical protein